jgi:hypothetical protein
LATRASTEGRRKLVERLAAKSTASIPKAYDSWRETCAAYRSLFFAKTDVACKCIRAPNPCAGSRARAGDKLATEQRYYISAKAAKLMQLILAH